VVREIRDAPTGMDEGAEIAILLASYGHHSGTGKSIRELEADPATIENELDACLRREMLSARQGLRFADSRALRQIVFRSQAAGESHGHAEKVLGRLDEVKFARDPRLARLRYVVLLDGTRWDSEAGPEFAASDAGFAIGAGWQRILSVRATVLDVVHRRTAGSVSAYVKGDRAVGLGVIIIIPVPLFFTTIPETADLCGALGPALARFLVP
jgi:hypothetical protein